MNARGRNIKPIRPGAVSTEGGNGAGNGGTNGGNGSGNGGNGADKHHDTLPDPPPDIQPDPRAGIPPPDPYGPELPQCSEAEQSVLGSLLQDNSMLPAVVDLIGTESFFSYPHRLVFGTIERLRAESKVADPLTVFERLHAQVEDDQKFGGLAYINALEACVPSARNARAYAMIVADRAAQRALIAGLSEATKISWAAALPMQERMDRIGALMHRVDLQRLTPTTNRVPLLPLKALREASRSVHWLCKHIIPSDSVGMMFGGSGTFKSFIALDLALHIAHGLPWMGRKTTKGPVLYIAAEGGAGLWPRIEAWHRARNLRWEDAQMHVVPAAIDLGTNSWRVVEAAQLVGVAPVLVIVDTLSQTFAGEENNAGEVAAYLRELGARFRQAWHCAVLLIHHTGHMATERPRGSSAIRGNLDFMLGVFRDEREMLATVSCNKQKDGELFSDSTFSLTVIELGLDDDDDRITSLVARHLTTVDEIEQAVDAEKTAGRIGPNQLLILELAQNGMLEKELRHLFYDRLDLSEAEKAKPDAKRQAYHRVRQWALRKGYFEVADGYVLMLRAVERGRGT